MCEELEFDCFEEYIGAKELLMGLLRKTVFVFICFFVAKSMVIRNKSLPLQKNSMIPTFAIAMKATKRNELQKIEKAVMTKDEIHKLLHSTETSRIERTVSTGI